MRKLITKTHISILVYNFSTACSHSTYRHQVMSHTHIQKYCLFNLIFITNNTKITRSQTNKNNFKYQKIKHWRHLFVYFFFLLLRKFSKSLRIVYCPIENKHFAESNTLNFFYVLFLNGFCTFELCMGQWPRFGYVFDQKSIWRRKINLCEFKAYKKNNHQQQRSRHA